MHRTLQKTRPRRSRKSAIASLIRNSDNLPSQLAVIGRKGIASTMNEDFHAIDGRFRLSWMAFRSIPYDHNGSIHDETFLMFPIRSRTRSGDLSCPETAQAFPSSSFQECRANRAQSSRGDSWNGRGRWGRISTEFAVTFKVRSGSPARISDASSRQPGPFCLLKSSFSCPLPTG